MKIFNLVASFVFALVFSSCGFFKKGEIAKNPYKYDEVIWCSKENHSDEITTMMRDDYTEILDSINGTIKKYHSRTNRDMNPKNGNLRIICESFVKARGFDGKRYEGMILHVDLFSQNNEPATYEQKELIAKRIEATIGRFYFPVKFKKILRE